MEINTLRHFLAVANLENINRAAEQAFISPSALSKSISKLEEELGVKLFQRKGRNIALTDNGRFLREKALRIVDMEEAARTALGGLSSRLHVILCGQEVLLCRKGIEIISRISAAFPDVKYEFRPVATDEEAYRDLEQGNAHVAITTTSQPSDLHAAFLGEVHFVTCVGRGHKLYRRAARREKISIKEVIMHPFVSSTDTIFGAVGMKQSADGWRDDKNPRQIRFVTKSLKSLEALVISGRALAYLPDYYAAELDVKVLNITECPYFCKQKIRVVARKPFSYGWMSHVFV